MRGDLRRTAPRLSEPLPIVTIHVVVGIAVEESAGRITPPRIDAVETGGECGLVVRVDVTIAVVITGIAFHVPADVVDLVVLRKDGRFGREPRPIASHCRVENEVERILEDLPGVKDRSEI